MIERNFDIPFIANLALKEKQVQQNYRPVISVHKWFARRPGTLFRGLLLSEFSDLPLNEAFYQSNNLEGISMADPFMGGGTPILEANRLGCEVTGYDINPMAYWIVKQEIEHLDLVAYERSAEMLRKELEKKIGKLYRSRCECCQSNDAHVKYFLWVKVQSCTACGKDIDLFPGYLVSQDKRHPANVILCGKCGALTESANREKPGKCGKCKAELLIAGPAKRGRCLCPHCGKENRYPNPAVGAPRHRLFAIEYHCNSCKPRHKGRFFKTPDADDLARAKEAEREFSEMEPLFVPDDRIPKGDESSRLHNWGYEHYWEMFNERQKLGLEMSCRVICEESDERVRNALATNLSDLLRYQNMLCRYDAMALKSLDIFSVHGFPVGLIQCESNLIGIRDEHKKINVGSGGWSNIIDKYSKAKSYCDFPFEFKHRGKNKIKVNIKDEWIGDVGNGLPRKPRRVDISCADASNSNIEQNSLDAVFTDPPYFENVQYAELMDFCYVWLRKLLVDRFDAFSGPSTRNGGELTGNLNMGRDLTHFAEGLSSVFCKMSKALKPGSPFVFTYHHNRISAYFPIAVAILDAELTCSASLPCPAEMSASIHINKTASSIIDTVFVLRKTGFMRRSWIVTSFENLLEIVRQEIESLKKGGVKPTKGDIRCIINGHLIRLVIWNLRAYWEREKKTEEKLKIVEAWINDFADLKSKENFFDELISEKKYTRHLAREETADYEGKNDEIPF